MLRAAAAAICSAARQLPAAAAGALRGSALLHTSAGLSARWAGFDLTEEQLEFQHVADTFAKEELAPFSAEWDEKHIFPIDTLKKAAELGFAGLYVSEDVGGAGLSRLDAAIIFEALSWGCIPTAAYLSIHNMARPGLLVVLCCGGHSLGSGQGLPIHTDLGLGSEFACASLCRLRHAGRVWPAAGANRPAAWYPSGPSAQPPHLYPSSQVASVIDKWGSQHLRGEYLPALTAMEARASYCLTEPGSGSDAASLKTTARREGDHYVLNGQKIFISGGGSSHLYLVMARTGEPGPKGISAFLIEKDTEGLSFGKPERKMGWNAQPTTTVMMDNVRVPADSRVGQEGEGFKIAMWALDGGRVNIGACSIGGGQFCLDTARQYAQQRQQFGSPIATFQATQFKFADMATQVQASRLMVRHAAAALDSGSRGATLECAMAKRFATDACFDVANSALQLLGGYGYLSEYPIERYMRDLRVHSILEGTNEIMRLIINRELDKVDPVA